MARMFRNRSKEPEKIVEESVVVSESIKEDLVTENTQEDKPEDQFKEEEELKNTVEIQESIKLHNRNIPLEIKKPESHTDQGGLKGNPGQQARFNHVMENKHGEIGKYFHSGKK